MRWLNLDTDEAPRRLAVLATREELRRIRRALEAARREAPGGRVHRISMAFDGIPEGMQAKEIVFIIHPYSDEGQEESIHDSLSPRLVRLLREHR